MSLLQNMMMGVIGIVGPSVDALTSGNTTSTSDNPCISGVEYRSNGNERGSTGAGVYSTVRGAWLTSGTGAEVWLERTLNTGTLNNSDPGAGRLQMNSSRIYAVEDTSIPGGPVTCNVTFDFYDAVSGGNLLDTVTFTLSAERGA